MGPVKVHYLHRDADGTLKPWCGQSNNQKQLATTRFRASVTCKRCFRLVNNVAVTEFVGENPKT